MTELLTPAPVDARVSHRRAMRALVRVESIRFVRHPLTIAALLLFLAPWIYSVAAGGTGPFAVLHDAVVDLEVLAMFALGSGALAVANLAALRAHRHRTDELYGTLVLPAPWRAGAVLLALVPYAAVATAVVGARLGVLALRPGAVGRPDPAEVALVPAVIVLFGAVGVLLAVTVRSAVIAPLVTVVLAVAMLAALIAGAEGRPWVLRLTPVTPEGRGYSLPAALVERAPGWHLLYVLGLIGVLVAVTLGRAGARRTLVPLAVAVVVAVGAGAVQFRGDPAVERLRADVTRDPAPVESCRVRDGVEYCALGELSAWVPYWDEVVRGVLRVAPTVAGPALAVRQRVWLTGRPDAGGSYTSSGAEDEARIAAWRQADTAAGHPEAVMLGTSWGSDADAASFAAAVAFRVLTGTAVASQSPVCGARGALLIWLVGQATPGAGRGLRDLDASSWGAVSFFDESLLTSVAVPDRDAAAGLALLERPAGAVAAVVRAHWDELASADTPLERFGELLDIPVAAAGPVEERPTCAG
ncbi:hypothetical protein [Dactylosporangium sp. NPDC051541]|uniref:hypothetical protein n=1 Tax=Dactylosporangium sp. NPDC051541 TaxID=3363977 RepID=UPI0037B4AAD8